MCPLPVIVDFLHGRFARHVDSRLLEREEESVCATATRMTGIIEGGRRVGLTAAISISECGDTVQRSRHSKTFVIRDDVAVLRLGFVVVGTHVI